MSQLMWTEDPQNLVKPRLLFSAAPMADVALWRANNPWADAIEIVSFQADAPGDAAALGAPFSEPGTAPWRVLGASHKFPKRQAHEAAYARLGIAGPGFVNEIKRYRRAIRIISSLVPSHVAPIWTVMADADDGILAVELAACRGKHVAIVVGDPAPIAINLATELGVSIMVARKSDQHLRNVAADLERLKWH